MSTTANWSVQCNKCKWTHLPMSIYRPVFLFLLLCLFQFHARVRSWTKASRVLALVFLLCRFNNLFLDSFTSHYSTHYCVMCRTLWHWPSTLNCVTDLQGTAWYVLGCLCAVQSFRVDLRMMHWTGSAKWFAVAEEETDTNRSWTAQVSLWAEAVIHAFAHMICLSDVGHALHSPVGRTTTENDLHVLYYYLHLSYYYCCLHCYNMTN